VIPLDVVHEKVHNFYSNDNNDHFCDTSCVLESTLVGAPGWLSQLKRPALDFGSSHHLRAVRSSPALGTMLSRESASLPLPLPQRKKESESVVGVSLSVCL